MMIPLIKEDIKAIKNPSNHMALVAEVYKKGNPRDIY
jgi:hypothetical protein